MNGDPATVRVYRSLLRLYPRQFRDEYGADMVQLLRDQCSDEPSWQVGARCALDLAITIPTQLVATGAGVLLGVARLAQRNSRTMPT